MGRESFHKLTVFLRLFVLEIRHHRNLHVQRILPGAIEIDRPRGCLRLKQVIGETLGIGRRGHRLLVLVHDQSEQIGLLFARQRDGAVGEQIHGTRIVGREQRGNDGIL